MTDEQKKVFEKKLLKSIQDTQENINALEEEVKPIPPENSLGRVTRMDAINNKSVAEASLRIARRKYAKLQNALKTLEDPDFGKCSSCGNDIQAERLMFMPESNNCVRCSR